MDCAPPFFLVAFVLSDKLQFENTGKSFRKKIRRDLFGLTRDLLLWFDSRAESEYVVESHESFYRTPEGLQLGREMTRWVMFSERSFARDIFAHEVSRELRRGPRDDNITREKRGEGKRERERNES